MTEPFFLRALAAALGVAVVAGPLGCFVVWRRLAYFGDAMAHTALLGVAAGIALGIDPALGIAAVTAAAALLLAFAQRQKALGGDTLLGILAHAALALGLIALSFLPAAQADPMALLVGDVTKVSRGDVWRIVGGGAIALAVLVFYWRRLLALAVHEDLARVEGVGALLPRLVYMLLLAVTIAAALKIVGVLLVTSLLIIPAAAARRLAATPEQMALGAIAIGCLSVVGGLYGSLTWDAPAGPSIVVAATLLFAMTSLVRKRG